MAAQTLLSLVLLAGLARAQVDWAQLSPARPRATGPLVRDPLSGGVLMVALSHEGQRNVQTWRWNGNTWQRLADVPQGNVDTAAVTFDVNTNRVVLLLKLYSTGMSTWEFDGVAWQLAGTSPMSLRRGYAIAYDAVRARVVLFGGRDEASSGLLNDTWEWYGTTWLQITTASAPAPRRDHCLAYHAGIQRVVLFGGASTLGPVADTWTWDGITWQQLNVVGPSPRSVAGIGQDPNGQLVVHGGYAPYPAADTWVFDGTLWRPVTGGSPPLLSFPSLAYGLGVGRTVAIGTLPSETVPQVFEWDGSRWARRTSDGEQPLTWPVMATVPPRTFFDTGSVRMVSRDRVWFHTNGVWQAGAALPSPGTSHGSWLVHDTLRHTSVLVTASGGVFGTWELNAFEQWIRVSTPSEPAGIALGAAFDTARARVVATVLMITTNQVATWEYDGTTWTQATAVTPQLNARLAYDEIRQVTVLFGGVRVGSQAHGDQTWEYDGVAWRQLNPVVRPPARAAQAMAYDRLRQRVVISGGATDSTGRQPLSDQWEWDGRSWTLLAPVNAPRARWGSAMAYDPVGRQMVLFGGNDAGLEFQQDTWALASRHSPGAASYGLGCPGTAGYPTLAEAPGRHAWIGDAWQLETRFIPQGAPALLMIGESPSSWAGIPLPIDLTPIGMPQCRLLASPTLMVAMNASGSAARAVVPLPFDRSLVGASIYSQALVVDPSANRLGATTSNGLDSRVGAR